MNLLHDFTKDTIDAFLSAGNVNVFTYDVCGFTSIKN